MSNKKKTSGGFSSLMSVLAIVISLVAGVIIFKFIFGDPANFVEGDPNGEPLEGNILGVIYKGGVIVPFLLAVNIIVIIFAVERFVTLSKARGKGRIDAFVAKMKTLLEAKQVNEAIEACGKQGGSLGNVVLAGLEKYTTIVDDTSMNKEQKVESLKKELEEATALELPILYLNLP
jgi:biopolymer transport protein ExbB